MDDSRKRTLSNVVTFVFFLCGGIEYAIILPSLWPFLDLYFNSTHAFYGLCFAAFSISGLICGPIFGLWSDRIQAAKPIVLFCNLFEIAGNLLYFSARSEYMVLGGRFLAGIGTGAGAAVFAMIARTSTLKDRTRVIALAISCRFIGLIIGPGLNAATAKIPPVNLGPFVIDKYTSPGLVMVVVWIIVEIMIMFMFFDFPVMTDAEAAGNVVHAVNDSEMPRETDPLLENNRVSAVNHVSYTTPPSSPRVPAESSFADSAIVQDYENWWSKILDLLREEWVVLLAAQFILFFNQTALETLIVPLGKEMLGWDILDTSIFYCGCAVEGILCFVLLRWLSKFIHDRWLLLAGIIAEMVSLAILLYFVYTDVPEARKGEPEKTRGYIFIVTGSAVGIAALSFFSVSTTSLLSKVTSNKHQGLSQGIRRSIGFVAGIMGPLWAGAFLSHLVFMLAVEEGLVGLLLVLVILSFSRLRVPSETSSHDPGD